jgi:hypothetical protein
LPAFDQVPEETVMKRATGPIAVGYCRVRVLVELFNGPDYRRGDIIDIKREELIADFVDDGPVVVKGVRRGRTYELVEESST